MDITPSLQDYCMREAEVNPQRGKVTEVLIDQVDNLALVLAAVRTGGLRTRPELVRELGLGRNVISQRVGQLLEVGLLDEGRLAPSTGGRPSRELRFRSEAGCLLVAELGATDLQVGLSDLTGELLDQRVERCDVAAGPEPTLGRLEQLFDELLAGRPAGVPLGGGGPGGAGPGGVSAGPADAPAVLPGGGGHPRGGP